MRRGGEHASVCTRAWVGGIRLKSKGCLVLVGKKRTFAQAQCGPGFATSQVQAATFTQPLGTCRAPGLGPAAPVAPASNIDGSAALQVLLLMPRLVHPEDACSIVGGRMGMTLL